MTIDIRSSETDPPTGEVVAPDGTRVPFAGWLDLMQTLSRLVSADLADAPAAAPNLVEAEGVAG